MISLKFQLNAIPQLDRKSTALREVTTTKNWFKSLEWIQRPSFNFKASKFQQQTPALTPTRPLVSTKSAPPQVTPHGTPTPPPEPFINTNHLVAHTQTMLSTSKPRPNRFQRKIPAPMPTKPLELIRNALLQETLLGTPTLLLDPSTNTNHSEVHTQTMLSTFRLRPRPRRSKFQRRTHAPMPTRLLELTKSALLQEIPLGTLTQLPDLSISTNHLVDHTQTMPSTFKLRPRLRRSRFQPLTHAPMLTKLPVSIRNAPPQVTQPGTLTPPLGLSTSTNHSVAHTQITLSTESLMHDFVKTRIFVYLSYKTTFCKNANQSL